MMRKCLSIFFTAVVLTTPMSVHAQGSGGGFFDSGIQVQNISGTDTSIEINYFTPPQINEGGTVIYTAFLSDTTGFRSSLRVATPTGPGGSYNVGSVAETGSTFLGLTGNPALSDSNHVTFTAANSTGGIGVFQGSVVISSDQPVVSVINTVVDNNSHPNLSSYSGLQSSAPAGSSTAPVHFSARDTNSQLFLPTVYKAFQNNLSSSFMIQNLDTTGTTVDVVFTTYDTNNQGDLLVTGQVGTTPPTQEVFAVVNESNPLHNTTIFAGGDTLGTSPNTGQTLVAQDSSFIGSASISSSGDSIAAVVNVLDPSGGGGFHQALRSYNGVTDPTSGQRFYIPTILKDTFGSTLAIDRVAATDGAIVTLESLDSGGQELNVKIGNQPFRHIVGTGDTYPGFAAPIVGIDIAEDGLVGTSSYGYGSNAVGGNRYVGQLAAAFFLADGTGIISLITIPEPTTLPLLVIGLLAIARRRYR